MLKICLRSIICLTVSQLHLPVAPILDYLCMMVILSLILMPTEVWLELCIILTSPDLTFALQCTKYVSICQLQLLLILLQQNVFSDIFGAHSIMVLSLLLVLSPCQLTQMPIGLGTQMIDIPHLVFLSTWATMPSPSQPRNKQPSLNPLLSQSIEHWPLPLLSSAGFDLFLKT